MRRPYLSFIITSLSLVWQVDSDARPDMRATSVSVSDTQVDRNQSVTVSWTARNSGDDGAGSTQQGVMWSGDSTISRNDTLLEKEFLGPISYPGNFFRLPSTSPEIHVVRIPTNAVIGRTYYIGVYADYDRDESESNESNNESNAVAVTINDNRPDFVARNVTIDGSNSQVRATPGESIFVEWDAVNLGSGTISTQQQGVMWSTDSAISRGDLLLDDEFMLGIGGGNERRQGNAVRVPDDAVPGRTYYIGVYMDYEGAHSERDESNNASSGLAVEIVVDLPDLIAEGLTVSDSLVDFVIGNKATSFEGFPGQSIYLHWTARNQGLKGSSILGTQQAIIWSSDANVTRDDGYLEKSGVGFLLSGQSTPEDQVVKIPEDALIGDTYYLAIQADYDRSETEANESNNLSNIVEIEVGLPSSYSAPDITDYQELPYLDDDDPRLRDSDNDGESNVGVTMNRSRCFSPGDGAYIHVDVEHDSEFLTILNATIPTRLRAYYNDSLSRENRKHIPGEARRNIGSRETRLSLPWTLPDAAGIYYVNVVVEVDFRENGDWEVLADEWIDGGVTADAITVTKDHPVVLVHGWKDKSGETFENLEMMIESQLKRPVLFFQYETSETVLFDGDAPRVDLPFTQNGVAKPSLADQLGEFLASDDIECVDVIAHSMGGLVSRQNALSAASKIRRLITLGTPNYGGSFADELDLVLNNQAEDLEYANQTAWRLHHRWESRRNELPELLAIVGTDDVALGKYNPSDGLVRCGSASLENLGYPVYYVPRPHTLSNGMAKVDNASHECWEPIRKFLSGQQAPFPGDPGNLGGFDDVGANTHPEALTAGLAYIVAQNGSPETLAAVEKANVEWSPDLADIRREQTSDAGIYFFVGRRADALSAGTEYYSDYTVTANPEGLPVESKSVRVKAGEATVLVIGNSPAVALIDQDGDLLPDDFEDRIVNFSDDDAFSSHHDVVPGGDFDGDGLTELYELAFGTDPLVADSRGVLSTHREAGFLVLAHPVVQADHLNISAVKASDLRTWSACLNSRTVVSGFPFPAPLSKEWRIPIGGPDRFLRLLLSPR